MCQGVRGGGGGGGRGWTSWSPATNTHVCSSRSRRGCRTWRRVTAGPARSHGYAAPTANNTTPGPPLSAGHPGFQFSRLAVPPNLGRTGGVASHKHGVCWPAPCELRAASTPVSGRGPARDACSGGGVPSTAESAGAGARRHRWALHWRRKWTKAVAATHGGDFRLGSLVNGCLPRF